MHGVRETTPRAKTRLGESSPLWRYGAALVFAAVAALLRLVLDPWLGPSRALGTLYGAVALAVWFGGLGPAVLATAAGFLTKPVEPEILQSLLLPKVGAHRK